MTGTNIPTMTVYTVLPTVIEQSFTMVTKPLFAALCTGMKFPPKSIPVVNRALLGKAKRTPSMGTRKLDFLAARNENGLGYCEILPTLFPIVRNKAELLTLQRLMQAAQPHENHGAIKVGWHECVDRLAVQIEVSIEDILASKQSIAA